MLWSSRCASSSSSSKSAFTTKRDATQRPIGQTSHGGYIHNIVNSRKIVLIRKTERLCDRFVHKKEKKKLSFSPEYYYYYLKVCLLLLPFFFLLFFMNASLTTPLCPPSHLTSRLTYTYISKRGE